MSRQRLETKVGVFVLVGLLALAGMMILFSKGASFDWNKYHLDLRAANIGGLKRSAAVLMSGVQVGSVSGIRLGHGGTNVIIILRIDNRVRIYRDAKFAIEKSGFLGDPYVAVAPTVNAGPVLQEGDQVDCEEPFNLLEVARNASGFIARIDDTAKKLDDAVADLRRYVLNADALSNLSVTIGNVRSVSENAMIAVDNVNTLVQSNSSPLSASISNLTMFSERINELAANLGQIAATNAPDISATVENLKASSESLKYLMGDLGGGRGLVPTLFKDEQVAVHFSLLSSNLAITSSNLNRLGLWGILWQRKPASTNPAPTSVYTGRDPTK